MENPLKTLKLWNKIKKTLDEDENELSVAEKRRYEEIVMIQNYLAQGYAPVEIRELMHTSYARIRRYATGDAHNMCRFSRQGSSQLDKYRAEIIDLLNQNVNKKEIFDKITTLGYTGKMTALKVYCLKLVAELQIQYTPKKNIIGVAVNPNQKPDVHYVTRQDIFKHLWSGEEFDTKTDSAYLFENYSSLTELKQCINNFREIYIYKNPKLLDWFIAIYSQSSIRTVASFANGLLTDIDAVSNSVTSTLSNGFVEGNNNRIKVIKRIMYGRAKINLLSAKVVQGINSN